MRFKSRQGCVSFKLDVKENENLACLRECICTRLFSAEKINSKAIVFKFNKCVLDVNKCFEQSLPSLDVTIDCEINERFKSSISVTILGRSEMVIEINPDQTILDLRLLLKEICHEDILGIYKDNEGISDETIVKSELRDNDKLKIGLRVNGQIHVNSILESIEDCRFDFSHSETVKNLKEKISEKIKVGFDDFTLFLNYEWLEEEKCLYEYEIKDGSQIKYCTFTRYQEEPVSSHSLKTGTYSEIFTNKGMLVKQYTYSQSTTSLKPLIRELITFSKIQCHERIIQFLAFYKDSDSFYIGMELMPGGSLEEYVKKNGALKEDTIRRWSKQILEGLECLHENKIILRDLKTSNILLKNEENIKLSGLSLSRYFMGCDADELKQGMNQTRVGTFRYMAPEVSNAEPYGFKADVWSFGAVLVEMVTGEHPYPKMSSVMAGREIANKKTIPYRLPLNSSNELEPFIAFCLKAAPEDRWSVNDLLQHDFLKVSLIDL